MLDPNLITDDERTLLLDALPAVKRENPQAEEIIRRLITAVEGLSAAPAHISIARRPRPSVSRPRPSGTGSIEAGSPEPGRHLPARG